MVRPKIGAKLKANPRLARKSSPLDIRSYLPGLEMSFEEIQNTIFEVIRHGVDPECVLLRVITGPHEGQQTSAVFFNRFTELRSVSVNLRKGKIYE